MARRGMAWQGGARQGEARQGTFLLGESNEEIRSISEISRHQHRREPAAEYSRWRGRDIRLVDDSAWPRFADVLQIKYQLGTPVARTGVDIFRRDLRRGDAATHRATSAVRSPRLNEACVCWLTLSLADSTMPRSESTYRHQHNSEQSGCFQAVKRLSVSSRRYRKHRQRLRLARL